MFKLTIKSNDLLLQNYILQCSLLKNLYNLFPLLMEHCPHESNAFKFLVLFELTSSTTSFTCPYIPSFMTVASIG